MDFEDIEKELKRMREYFKRMLEWRPSFELPEFREPLADVEETPEAVKVTVELPGITKEDVSIDVTPESLRIKAEKKKALEEKRKGFYRAERTYKGFYRAMTLPCRIDPERASAEYKEGVLTITLPKAERKVIAKKIRIK